MSISGEQAREAPEPVGTVDVYDPHPLTAVHHVEHDGEADPDRSQRLPRDGSGGGGELRTETELAIKVRAGARFQDGEPCTAHSIKQNFDEVQKRAVPRPPGTHLNFHPDSECIVEDDQTCVFRFPEPDGFVLGNFRGFHIASMAFWNRHGFGYVKSGTGEGHW